MKQFDAVEWDYVSGTGISEEQQDFLIFFYIENGATHCTKRINGDKLDFLIKFSAAYFHPQDEDTIHIIAVDEDKKEVSTGWMMRKRQDGDFTEVDSIQDYHIAVRVRDDLDFRIMGFNPVTDATGIRRAWVEIAKDEYADAAEEIKTLSPYPKFTAHADLWDRRIRWIDTS